MKNALTEIGQNIKKIRVGKRLKAFYIAKQLHISLFTFRDLENGIATIKFSKLQELAAILEVPLEELISPEDERLLYNQITANELNQQIKQKEEDIKKLLQKIIRLYDELKEMGKF